MCSDIVGQGYRSPNAPEPGFWTNVSIGEELYRDRGDTPSMTTFVDSSALLKNYFAEPDSSVAERLLNSDSVLVTGWATFVEVRRNLGLALRGAELRQAKDQFAADWDSMAIIAVDETVCRAAAQIGRADPFGHSTRFNWRARSGWRSRPFITFDLRQAQAARSLGFTVLGS